MNVTTGKNIELPIPSVLAFVFVLPLVAKAQEPTFTATTGRPISESRACRAAEGDHAAPHLRLPLTGPPGQRVRVQRSTNLSDWEDWQTVILDGSTLELTDDNATAAQRFYRAVEDSPDP